MRFKTRHPLRILLLVLLFWAGLDHYASAQCSLVCKPALQISLNQNGTGLVTAQMIAPSANNSCPGALSVELSDDYGNPLPNPLDCNQIGQSITATLTHNQSGNSCNSTITLLDLLPPTATCPDIWIWCGQDIDPVLIGSANAMDNCTSAASLSLNWVDTETDLSCGTLQNGVAVKKRIDRVWTVSDEAGNSSMCNQKIWARQIALNAINFPANRDNISLPALDCSENPEDLNITGQPSVDGVALSAFGGCEIGITYADQPLAICPPAGFALLRTWTAVDFCTGTVSNRLQIIKVLDSTAPNLLLPADITLGTAGFACTGVVNLPLASTSDNCSTVTVSPVWAFGSGYGPFNAVPLGTHLVTYTATDACSNSRTSTLRVTVVDNTPPQAICKSSLQISLSSNGVAYATPAVLDGGSNDNCGPVTMLVSRDGISFANTQALNCADQIVPVVLTLKVTDATGNTNLCETALTVRDFLKPDLQCPPNLTLNCQQDYTNLNLTGQATASDNCGLDTLFFTNQLNLGACNIGNLARVWRALDDAGNVRTCTQQITIASLSTVTVQFPNNKVLQACAGPQDLLPANTGSPNIGGQYCSPLSITYIDQVFSAPAPYCKRILRAWKVIDGCIYTGNIGSPGIWENTQTIDIVDQQAPVLALPAPIVATTGSGVCQAYIDVPAATALDCSTVVTIIHNSPYAAAQGAKAAGLYPVGLHKVVFTATDDCGNSAQKTLSIEVQDQTKPNALCKTNVTLPLSGSGTAVLTPNDIDAGSNDACSTSGSLSKFVAPSSFNCAQLGLNQVILTVGDLSGNVSTCTTSVKITDPNQYCGTGSGDTYIIGGGIMTEFGDTVRSLPVQVITTGLSIWSDCDTTGHFLVEDMAADSQYRIRPYNNANWFNGLSTFDLVLISKHILGVLPLTSPYKMIAADANKSGSVTTFDIVQFRKLILGIYDTVPGITSWRFIPADYTFENPNNPFSAGFPEEIVIPSLQADQVSNDFIGLKVGDMNNSTDPATARAPQDTVWMHIKEQVWSSGNVQMLTLALPDLALVDGFQFELELDTALVQLDGVFPSGVLQPEHVALHPGGRVRVSYNVLTPMETGDAGLAMQIRAKKPISTYDFLKIQTDRFAAEWYDPAGTASLMLQTGTKQAGNNPLRLLGAIPNPYSTHTTIQLEVPHPQNLQLFLYDALGRLCLQASRDFLSGMQEWPIKTTSPPSAGLLWYQIVNEAGDTVVGKLLYQPER